MVRANGKLCSAKVRISSRWPVNLCYMKTLYFGTHDNQCHLEHHGPPHPPNDACIRNAEQQGRLCAICSGVDSHRFTATYNTMKTIYYKY